MKMELSAAGQDFESSVWSCEAAFRSCLVHSKGK